MVRDDIIDVFKEMSRVGGLYELEEQLRAVARGSSRYVAWAGRVLLHGCRLSLPDYR
jgi:hypothetical protein